MSIPRFALPLPIRLIGLLLLLSACEGGRPQPETAAGREEDAPSVSSPLQGSWWSGDMHVHTDHSADGSGLRQLSDHRLVANVGVDDQIAEAVRAGLEWLPLTDHRTYAQHYDPAWTSDQLLLIPGEEANGSPHANPLGAVDSIVQGAVPEGRPEWSRLQSSIWDAHAQGAIWSHNHPDDGHLEDDGSPNPRSLAVGADAVEIWNRGSDIAAELSYAEGQWNLGHRMVGVGASDNHFRELWGIAGPGSPVTRVFSSAPNERAVLQALAAGRVSLSVRGVLAPQLHLLADWDGQPGYESMAGDELLLLPGQRGRLRVEVQGALGATVLLYRSPGRSIGPYWSTSVDALDFVAEVELQSTERNEWIYAEVRGVGEVDAVPTEALQNPLLLVEPGLGTDERRAITAPLFFGPTLAQPEGADSLPPDQGIDDGARLALGEQGAFAGFPDVARADGLLHLVAEQHAPGQTQVWYRALDGSAAQQLSGDSTSARFPRVAARGAEVWVVWQDERAGQIPRRPAIYLRHSTDRGRSWGPEQLLRAVDGRAEKPAIAVGPRGEPGIVWQEIAPGKAFDIWFQQGLQGEAINLSAAGKSTAPDNGIDTRSALHPASIWPQISASSQGRFAVVFQDNRHDPDPLWTSGPVRGEEGATEVDDYQIGVLTRAADGAWTQTQWLGAADRIDAHPDVEFAADGSLLVVWDSRILQPAGANLSIRWAHSSDGAQWLLSTEGIAEAPEHMSQYPRLGVDADGQPRVVWYDGRSADWRWRIATTRWQGQGWGQLQLLPSLGNNTWPATAGGALVFASTRHARRWQRDPTQQIVWKEGL